ncbi:MAG TPA: histone deacetylase [Humisphaera sp.]
MPALAPKLVYHPAYNISFFGLERLHPFDSRKYGRAYKLLRQEFGRAALKAATLRPPGPISRAELLAVHTPEYLDKLRDPKYVAGVLELPPLRRAPGWLADWRVLRPMRWATAGTVLAAEAAIECGLVMNLGGGYHHASQELGHGFSAYADVGLAVDRLRRTGRLGPDDLVAHVDLDAHQGDGVCRTFFGDRRVFILDCYHGGIFPLDSRARGRVDCNLPLKDRCPEADYQSTVRAELPRFLDSICRGGRVKLAIYNAGTDPFVGDQLGRLCVSADGLFERDQFVIDELTDRGLPTVVLTSGGYSAESYRFVARTAAYVLRKG